MTATILLVMLGAIKPAIACRTRAKRGRQAKIVNAEREPRDH